ncbi:hypothetical protein ACQRD6_12740 [Prevotella sp. SGI.027]
MNKMKIYLMMCFFYVSLLPIQAQNSNAETFLKKVLVCNARIRESKSSPSSIHKQLIELYQKTCTNRLFGELVNELNENGLDHDLITSDYGFDGYSLKTIKVSKDSSNIYRVSYQVFITNINGKQEKFDVVLYYEIKVININLRINGISVLLEDGTICRIV